MVKKFAILLLFICLISDAFCATCPDKLAGITKWSTWSSKPTTVGASVTIGASQIILLDVSPPRLNQIDVFGTLVIDPTVATLDLAFSALYVRKGGKLYMGSSECPLTNKVTVTLVGQPQPGVDPMGVGTKVLGVLEGGLIEIHGTPRTPVWTVLAQSAKVNDTQITLSEDVDWAVGETIVIATTDFEDFEADTTQNEKVVITARPSSKVVSFATPLKYNHYGKIWSSNGDSIDMRGEVGLLNRNIIIKGDIDPVTSGNSEAQKWGGHVMIRDGGIGRIEYAEVTLLGQKGEFGRYPLHFHNSSAQPNSYLRGNSVHDTYQRCIVVHSTFNLRVQNNFAYRGVGHCYFIEDGNEEQNVFEHNLGVWALQGTLLTSDVNPAMFWITNPLNHFYQNVAVGGKFGFWYSMPQHPLALSASQVSNLLRYKSNGDFIGNKGHSSNSGLFVDKGLANAKPGDAFTDTSYYPVNWTAHLDLAAKLGSPVDLTKVDEYALSVLGFRQPATFVDFIAYKNVEHGMWGRGSNMWSYGPKLADNAVGCVWPGEANLFQNAVIIGETDNVGNFNLDPRAWYGDEEGRSRPVKYFLWQPIMGYSSYDAGGGDLVINVNFHNFNDYTFTKGGNAGNIRKSGAITGITGPNVIFPKNRIYRANFYNVQNRAFYRQSYPWDQQLSLTDDAVKGIVWVDADGSLTKGLPEAGCGKQIVGPGSQVRTSQCVQKADWNAYICPANANAHRHIEISQDDTVNSATYNMTTFRWTNDLHVRRLSDASSVDVEAEIRDYSTYYTASYSYGTNVITNNAYYVTLGNANSFLSNFRVQLFDAPKGEKLRLAFPIPNGASVTVTTGGYSGEDEPAKKVDTYAALGQDSYYVDSANGILWLGLESSYMDYNYYYGVPVPTNFVAFFIKVTGCGTLCSFSAKSIPSGSVSGSTANLCETSVGASVGSVNTYTTKTSSVLNVFSDAFASPWQFAETVPKCNISSEMAQTGTSSLKCTLGQYGYTSFSRNWDSRLTPYPLTAYTHVQMGVRVAAGYGDINLNFAVVNTSWGNELGSVRMGAPEYTDNAGQIDDTRWTTVRIPVSHFASPSFNVWGVAISNSYPRPVIIYIDNIQFVSLTQTSQAISGFPVAPAKPKVVGPGPEFIYGAGTPTSKPSTSATAAATVAAATNSGATVATSGATVATSGASATGGSGTSKSSTSSTSGKSTSSSPTSKPAPTKKTVVITLQISGNSSQVDISKISSAVATTFGVDASSVTVQVSKGETSYTMTITIKNVDANANVMTIFQDSESVKAALNSSPSFQTALAESSSSINSADVKLTEADQDGDNLNNNAAALNFSLLIIFSALVVGLMA